MSEKTIAKKQTYRVALFYNKMPPPFQNGGGILVRPTGFEPAAFGVGELCLSQILYAAMMKSKTEIFCKLEITTL